MARVGYNQSPIPYVPAFEAIFVRCCSVRGTYTHLQKEALVLLEDDSAAIPTPRDSFVPDSMTVSVLSVARTSPRRISFPFFQRILRVRVCPLRHKFQNQSTSQRSRFLPKKTSESNGTPGLQLSHNIQLHLRVVGDQNVNHVLIRVRHRSRTSP